MGAWSNLDNLRHLSRHPQLEGLHPNTTSRSSIWHDPAHGTFNRLEALPVHALTLICHIHTSQQRTAGPVVVCWDLNQRIPFLIHSLRSSKHVGADRFRSEESTERPLTAFAVRLDVRFSSPAIKTHRGQIWAGKIAVGDRSASKF